MTAVKAKASARDRIMAAKIKGEPYEVAEWDTTINLRSMSITERDKLTEIDADVFIATVLSNTCFDPETGEAVWTVDDAEWFGDQPAGVIEPLLEAALRVSGLGQLAKAVEQGKDAS